MTSPRKAKPEKKKGTDLKRNWPLYLFYVLPLVYFLIFKYLPMIGNIIAFRRYQPGGNLFGEYWVGLRYFKQFIKDAQFWRAFRNTLTLSIGYLVVRFPLTLLFALCLNEIRRGFVKRGIQTISYLPHFISMVIVAGMIKEMVSLTGPINGLLKFLGQTPIPFITKAQWFPVLYIVSGVWQGLGWGAIMYIAAMSNINTELYEAAVVDGANRFRQAWHVTIPGIMTTVVTLLILDVGRIMSINFDKVLLLYNPATYSTSDVIATYLYRLGIESSNFSYAAAIGMFEAVVGLILISLANFFSRKLTETSLW